MDNSGDNHSESQNGRILLNKGKIPLKVICYENSGTESLSVLMKGPGMDRQVITPFKLFLNSN